MIQALPEAVDTSRPTDSAPTRIRRVLRRWGWVAVAAVLVTALGVVNATSGYSTQAFHHRNPGERGAMALAEILKDQGVRVVPAVLLPDLEVAATEGTTLFVPDPSLLTEEEWDALASAPSDLVVTGSPFFTGGWIEEFSATSPRGSTSPLTAQCEDPDAAAASRISPIVGGLTPGPDGGGVTFCFPTEDGTFGYSVWEHEGRTVRMVADPALFVNRNLDEDGNAALTLRALGHHPTLVWYQPAAYGAGAVEQGWEPLRTLPPIFGPLVPLLAGIVLLLALWRGKRMGPVVTEPLPVVVKPGEAVHGRGRLYHRAGSTGHAAAGLRAGTARRLARRLGLTRATAPTELVTAIAAASGRSAQDVGTLLYGPPPTTSADLVRIAGELKELEESTR
ncbi:MAG: DUF4350 domain-containing protein [bacterium]|nr:DUF4350 domain-containing protein [bacterium]